MSDTPTTSGAAVCDPKALPWQPTVEDLEEEVHRLREALRTVVALAAKHSDLWTKDDYKRLHAAKQVLG